MYKYEYKVSIIGTANEYVCSVSFYEKQHEEDVVNLIMTNDYHSTVKSFIPKHAVSFVRDLKGEFLSED